MLIAFLVTIIVFLIVLYVIKIVIAEIPLPPSIKTIIYLIVGLIFLLWILQFFHISMLS